MTFLLALEVVSSLEQWSYAYLFFCLKLYFAYCVLTLPAVCCALTKKSTGLRQFSTHSGVNLLLSSLALC